MHTKELADQAVQQYLRKVEREMDNFGSALPQNSGEPPQELAVSKILEQDDLWVYFYNSSKFIESRDFSFALVGNAPIIVDRKNGQLYLAGTSHPIDFYIQEFRSGNLLPLQF